MKNSRLTAAALLILAIFTAVAAVPGMGAEARASDPIRIGVLAHKGTNICKDMWQPTMDYLEAALPGRRFDLTPLQFDEIEPAVKNGIIDFLICNSAIYVDLEVKYGISRTMTLRNLVGTRSVSEFGCVIFRRADRSDLQNLRDARGRGLAAVRENSFGGWLMALREFRSAGIDPGRDCARLFFPGSHPAVVRAVLSGEADIGVVRTDTLERMAADGEIRLDEIRIIPADTSPEPRSDFPYLLSTRLYPEWPFAKLSGTTEDLSREVTVALLSMPAGSPAAIAAQSGGWGVCLDYTSVHDCLRELRLPPYENFGRTSWPDVWRQYWPWLGAIATLFTALLGALLLLRGRQQAVVRVSGQNRLLLASAGEGICGIDIDGITTFVNPAATKMLGFTAGELIGGNLHDLTHHTKPDGQPYPNHECPVCMARINGAVYRGSDDFFYRKDGGAIAVSCSSRPIVDAGTIRGAVICFQDITRQKQVEENIRKISTAVEQSPATIVITDITGAIEYVNPKFTETTGYTFAEAMRQNPRILKSGELPPETYQELWDTILGGRIWRGEFRNKKKNGELYWEQASISPIRNIQGSITSFVAVKEDITEQKRIKEELLQINETLEQRVAQAVDKNMEQERMLIRQNRLAAMGEMIGNIAHQWRQPLNALGLVLFNIKDAFQFNTLDADFLDQAVADGSRLVQKMSATISDFSNFFRPDKEIVDFSALKQIREAVSLVESSFQKSDIAIHIHAPSDLLLLGFPNEYSQVLLNLLSNAREAILARQEPLSGRVDITIEAHGGQVGCVSVRDNGGGIPAESLDRIFDPYFSTKESGTGIGLYMSKMIIERNMNGSITAKNIEGGVEFRVCAPLAKETGKEATD